MNKKLFLFSLMLLLGNANKSFSYILHPYPNPSFQYHNGYLLQYKNNDTLWGAIKFGAFKNSHEALKFKLPDGKQIKIKISDVCYVRIFASDKNITDSANTQFYNLKHNNYLFRQIHSGKVMLFDQNLYTDEYKDFNNKWLSIRSSVFYVKRKNGELNELKPTLIGGQLKALTDFYKVLYGKDIMNNDFSSPKELLNLFE